ncbi:hypothetical protein SEMRO_1035_G233900.1 [Seminavis robusta]|uniref:Uncharacterized protein n=1 Tax=Seminavis robusta TaxID=568900 RepID=A0A9N8EI32_9STRA|nr:hypothetical protein SEMRO_1035_G233900.1 [Seminavis robusta]|eukprot:Sro1035_g233900.1 n/a (188) ;mRNA; f:14928-15664
MSLGEAVFALTSNNPDGQKNHRVKRIGKVVEVSRGYDSMLFQFESDVEVELYTIRTSNDTKFTFDLAAVAEADPDMRTRLFDFGAQRRGTVGEVSSRWLPDFPGHRILREDDIGITRLVGDENQNLKDITHDGDCVSTLPAASPQGDALPPPRFQLSFEPGEEPTPLEEEYIVMSKPRIVPIRIVED